MKQRSCLFNINQNFIGYGVFRKHPTKGVHKIELCACSRVMHSDADVLFMSKQTLFRFANAKHPRLVTGESTETSQTTQNINDKTEDEDGHPSSTATSTTGTNTKKNRVRSFRQSWTSEVHMA